MARNSLVIHVEFRPSVSKMESLLIELSREPSDLQEALNYFFAHGDLTVSHVVKVLVVYIFVYWGNRIIVFVDGAIISERSRSFSFVSPSFRLPGLLCSKAFYSANDSVYAFEPKLHRCCLFPDSHCYY
jgi:hypothetical protein